ncbi:nematocyst expressed protein 3-like isoform X2 [Agelaius tricolor]|uniref:nematocyst expressed protein 3-like isoform X2 n=1 Tax=Agelaius tricolor TaxID=9191 RepID=UPI0039F26112
MVLKFPSNPKVAMATGRVREGGTSAPGSLPCGRPALGSASPASAPSAAPGRRPAPEAAPPGEAAPAEAASPRIAARRARQDLPAEVSPLLNSKSYREEKKESRLGKKHDQDELHLADHLHCSDCFLWLCLILSEDKPLLS